MWLSNFQKISCTTETVEKKLLQGKPWGKSRASASYYPGSVFDLDKLFLHKQCYTPKKKKCTTLKEVGKKFMSQEFTQTAPYRPPHPSKK